MWDKIYMEILVFLKCLVFVGDLNVFAQSVCYQTIQVVV